MQAGDAADANDLGKIAKLQSAAGHDFEAVACLRLKSADLLCAFEHVGCATGGKKAVGASAYDVFESLSEDLFEAGSFVIISRVVVAGDFVEGAMKGDAHGAGQFGELAGAGDVDLSIREQDAHGDASGSQSFGFFDLPAHEVEFGFRVGEVSPAGTNKDVNGDGDGLQGIGEQGAVGGNAANGQLGAELEAVSSAGLRSLGCFETFGAQLESVGFPHATLGVNSSHSPGVAAPGESGRASQFGPVNIGSAIDSADDCECGRLYDQSWSSRLSSKGPAGRTLLANTQEVSAKEVKNREYTDIRINAHKNDRYPTK